LRTRGRSARARDTRNRWRCRELGRKLPATSMIVRVPFECETDSEKVARPCYRSAKVRYPVYAVAGCCVAPACASAGVRSHSTFGFRRPTLYLLRERRANPQEG